MTLLSVLLGVLLLMGAALTVRAYRVGAALLVGLLCVAVILIRAFLGWSARHQGGLPDTFLAGHGLTAAPLSLFVGVTSGRWWAGLRLTSRFPLPERSPPPPGRLCHHIPLTVVGFWPRPPPAAGSPAPPVRRAGTT